MLGLVVKQAVEQIDSVRSVAVQCLATLLQDQHCAMIGFGAGVRGIRQEILGGAQASDSAVAATQTRHEGYESFPAMARWLEFEPIRVEVLQGFALSIGSATHSISQQASSALCRWLLERGSVSDALGRGFLLDLLHLCADDTQLLGHARVHVGLLRTLVLILTDASSSDLVVPRLFPNRERWLSTCAVAVKASRCSSDIPRLMASIDLSSAILIRQPNARDVMEMLAPAIHSLLCHSFPLVRRAWAVRVGSVASTHPTPIADT